MITEYRYLDIIWLDNLIMNFLLLWVVWKLSKNASSLWRLWSSACVGALYAVFLILPGFELLGNIWVKIVLSVVMLVVAYKTPTLRDFFKLFGLFYASTFLFGGAAFGLYYFYSSSIEFHNGIFYITNYPVKMLFISAVLVIMLARVLWPMLKMRINGDQLLYKMEIMFDNTCISLEALLDTGNDLSDPISQKPVMIVEYDKIKDILPGDIRLIYQQSKEDNLDYVTEVMANSSWIRRFRLIPYKALGSTNGMLIAYKPDKARIYINEGWQDIREIIVGIYNHRLSTDNQYHALIHPQIIQ